MDEVINESLLPTDSAAIADEDQVVSTAMSRM
jgi:hypothetical protein